MRNKRTSFCFYVLLLLSLLTGFEAAFGASGKDDDDNEQKQTIDLRKILQVQPLNLIELTGEVSIDGVLDEPFWKEATHYEIKLETYPAG